MTQCKHCQQGIHMGELEMTEYEHSKVTQKFELEPMERDTWHQPAKRAKSDVPFTFGGAA